MTKKHKKNSPVLPESLHLQFKILITNTTFLVSKKPQERELLAF